MYEDNVMNKAIKQAAKLSVQEIERFEATAATNTPAQAGKALVDAVTKAAARAVKKINPDNPTKGYNLRDGPTTKAGKYKWVLEYEIEEDPKVEKAISRLMKTVIKKTLKSNTKSRANSSGRLSKERVELVERSISNKKGKKKQK